MNPPPFKGTSDSQGIQDWISRLEKIFDAVECPEIEKVTCAAFIMEGEADRWWKLERERFIVNHELITWEKFVDCLYDRYFPQSIRDHKAVEFLELVQGSNTVGEYEAKFTELSRFAPQVISTENLKARKFVRGLRYKLRKQVTILRKQVTILRLPTFTEVLDRAFIAEKEVEEGRKFREQRKRSASEVTKCPRCDKFHPGKPCYWETKACFNWGEVGHIARACPSEPKNPATATMKEKENQKIQRIQGRAYGMTQGDAHASTSVITEYFAVFMEELDLLYLNVSLEPNNLFDTLKMFKTVCTDKFIVRKVAVSFNFGDILVFLASSISQFWLMPYRIATRAFHAHTPLHCRPPKKSARPTPDFPEEVLYLPPGAIPKPLGDVKLLPVVYNFALPGPAKDWMLKHFVENQHSSRVFVWGYVDPNSDDICLVFDSLEDKDEDEETDPAIDAAIG
ncbi:hypothetical protein BUALT_Bualt15G0139400 [Buddleja alternifolia]|uniref:Retrotransposon gag domain-containing protein n=1 Tax=Buddleja alternifolia TaxID=168488 RepID=A0AAV6WGY6_9LAMI|nr:hypothetical protein BUALT_Bualt15G0139400 [Buddleja alternifolia]